MRGGAADGMPQSVTQRGTLEPSLSKNTNIIRDQSRDQAEPKAQHKPLSFETESYYSYTRTPLAERSIEYSERLRTAALGVPAMEPLLFDGDISLDVKRESTSTLFQVIDEFRGGGLEHSEPAALEGNIHGLQAALVQLQELGDPGTSATTTSTTRLPARAVECPQLDPSRLERTASSIISWRSHPRDVKARSYHLLSNRVPREVPLLQATQVKLIGCSLSPR